jgi:hypothetical protein
MRRYSILTRRTQYLLFWLLLLLGVSNLQAQFTRLDWRVTNVGKVRQVLTNQGTLNGGATRYPGLINAEFPPGSAEEHLYQGGIWIGGITPTGDTLVSETSSHFGSYEFYPSAASWDTIWTGAKGDTLNIPYWPKYVAVSDQDFVCRYSDYNLLNIPNHTPLDLDIVQTTYSWSSAQLDEFLLHTYYITPRKIPIKDAYVAFWMHGSVGNVGATDNFIDEFTHWFPQYRMGVDEDSRGGSDGTSISPIGFAVVTPSDSTLRWSFQYYEHENLPNRDPEEYIEMSRGTAMPDRLERARAHIVQGFGPFQLKVGDTLKVQMGEIFGYGMSGLLKNAEYLKFLKTKNFRVPAPPPKPTMRITTSNQQVDIDWTPGAVNPELYTDQNRGDTISRPFEGYRLYRSTKSINGPWSLLAEYDLVDDIGSNTGLEYHYRDVGLLNNVEYYYTLTAFSKPDKVINFSSQESSMAANAQAVSPGTPPPETVGEVAAVPNPYRGDIAYNSYNPPWEHPQGDRPYWMEQDRRIQFINLPHSCEIRIYTVAGDLVTTLEHENATRGFEDWNLTSRVGQAVSSGIYLFTVQDRANGKVQVGKFVIIK